MKRLLAFCNLCPTKSTAVIPGLVPGTHRAASSNPSKERIGPPGAKLRRSEQVEKWVPGTPKSGVPDFDKIIIGPSRKHPTWAAPGMTAGFVAPAPVLCEFWCG